VRAINYGNAEFDKEVMPQLSRHARDTCSSTYGGLDRRGSGLFPTDDAVGDFGKRGIMAVKVSITGTLSMPRRAAVQLIESHTNAQFSPDVTYDVNYLVAARFDTNKAKRAVQIGVTVISEAEMLHCIQNGSFPENSKPLRPDVPHCPADDVVWIEEYNPARLCFLEYSDAEGVVSQRFIRLSCKGKGGNGYDYLGAFDDERFKTFRADRVVKLEDLSVDPLSGAQKSKAAKA